MVALHSWKRNSDKVYLAIPLSENFPFSFRIFRSFHPIESVNVELVVPTSSIVPFSMFRHRPEIYLFAHAVLVLIRLEAR